MCAKPCCRCCGKKWQTKLSPVRHRHSLVVNLIEWHWLQGENNVMNDEIVWGLKEDMNRKWALLLVLDIMKQSITDTWKKWNSTFCSFLQPQGCCRLPSRGSASRTTSPSTDGRRAATGWRGSPLTSSCRQVWPCAWEAGFSTIDMETRTFGSTCF